MFPFGTRMVRLWVTFLFPLFLVDDTFFPSFVPSYMSMNNVNAIDITDRARFTEVIAVPVPSSVLLNYNQLLKHWNAIFKISEMNWELLVRMTEENKNTDSPKKRNFIWILIRCPAIDKGKWCMAFRCRILDFLQVTTVFWETWIQLGGRGESGEGIFSCIHDMQKVLSATINGTSRLIRINLFLEAVQSESFFQCT